MLYFARQTLKGLVVNLHPGILLKVFISKESPINRLLILLVLQGVPEYDIVSIELEADVKFFQQRSSPSSTVPLS